MARSAFYHEVDDEGNRLTIVNGTSGRELNRSRLVRQAIWRPGQTVDDIGALDPDVYVPINPGAYDPAARVADMDAMGVDQAVVFPTLFNEYLPLVDNPQAAAALAQGYNDWVWDFAAQTNGRVHPVAILPLHSSLLARRELDRVAEKGFTSVVIRPAFYAASVIEDHSHAGPDRTRDGERGAPGSRWRRVVTPALRRERAVPVAVEPHRRARDRRVRAPGARDHRSRCDLEWRVRRARVAAARRRAHDRRADRAHAGRRPVRHHRVLPRSARRPAHVAAGDHARGHELGAARAGEVGDLPLALPAVRDGVRVPRTRRGLGPSPARRVVRQLGGVGGDHARPPRRQGGVGLALPEPRRQPVPPRRSRCSKRTTSTPPSSSV